MYIRHSTFFGVNFIFVRMASVKAPEDAVAYDMQPTKPAAPPPPPAAKTASAYSASAIILAVIVTFILSCIVIGIAVGIGIYYTERAKDTKTTTTKTVLRE